MRLGVLVLVLMALGGGVAAAEPRVVGGSRVSVEDYPWVVYLTDSKGNQFCGGTLVAPTKVVTAAHCAGGLAPKTARVVVGREDKRDTRRGVALPVADVWTHPEYVTADRGHDVAVLTLTRAAPGTPLELAGGDALYAAGTRATAFGWGRTSEQGAMSQFLMAVGLPVVSDESCEQSYALYKPELMVCAGVPEGGLDTCQGDSGGPLVAGGKLIGVTSWGEGCAREGKPGVYSRISAYRAELDRQIHDAV
ncbi:S1 family peptidase [Saccharothrix australiensis]|uniref:Trypsin n=1 Tax=Saccharothrix australiensis TaxID=2072 RepID=A0A495W6A1_9PSEU|nr:serine protease [Saccharothrix australiensis]RKT56989.1 trypsin [Saccharothrix australiensis]